MLICGRIYFDFSRVCRSLNVVRHSRMDILVFHGLKFRAVPKGCVNSLLPRRVNSPGRIDYFIVCSLGLSPRGASSPCYPERANSSGRVDYFIIYSLGQGYIAITTQPRGAHLPPDLLVSIGILVYVLVCCPSIYLASMPGPCVLAVYYLVKQVR